MQVHAEKKALAVVLAHCEAELSVSINFNACMDCHVFFKISSLLLGRRVLLSQPLMIHTFTDGCCSCNDRWSLEARLTPAKLFAMAAEEQQEFDAAAAKKRKVAAKHPAATPAEEERQLHAVEDKTQKKVAKMMAAAAVGEEQQLHAADAKKRRKAAKLTAATVAAPDRSS